MIALVASALLGLYIFLPVFFFDKLAASFVRLKKSQRTKTEEVVTGVLIAGCPFAATWILSRFSWYIGHWPLLLTDPLPARKVADYQTVFASLYSDQFFSSHVEQFWDSFWRVLCHQGRFLFWNYSFLLLEIGIVLLSTHQFGRLNRKGWFKWTAGKLLLRRVSEWHALLTPFVFHPNERRVVEVDLMTVDRHLYRGEVSDFFLDRDGQLTGLLLKQAKRYQYAKLEADRAAGKSLPLEDYWKNIPGANLFVPYDKTVTLNLRYEMPPADVTELLNKVIAQLPGLRGVVIQKQAPD